MWPVPCSGCHRYISHLPPVGEPVTSLLSSAADQEVFSWGRGDHGKLFPLQITGSYSHVARSFFGRCSHGWLLIFTI